MILYLVFRLQRYKDFLRYANASAFLCENRFESDGLGGRNSEKTSIVPFFRMNGREEELINFFAAVRGVLAFLQAAYDPETAGFGICEFVDMTANGFNVVVAEDDFDAGVGAAATTVHDGSAQPAVEEKVHIIKKGIDVRVWSFAVF